MACAASSPAPKGDEEKVELLTLVARTTVPKFSPMSLLSFAMFRPVTEDLAADFYPMTSPEAETRMVLMEDAAPSLFRVVDMDAKTSLTVDPIHMDELTAYVVVKRRENVFGDTDRFLRAMMNVLVELNPAYCRNWIALVRRSNGRWFDDVVARLGCLVLAAQAPPYAERARLHPSLVSNLLGKPSELDACAASDGQGVTSFKLQVSDVWT